MTSRSAQRKSTARETVKKTDKKSAPKSTSSSKTAKLPEWNLADLYAGIGAAEIGRDLQKMDAECVAFETAYKGKLAEGVISDDGGRWLAEAVRRYEAIDDLAGRLGSLRLGLQCFACGCDNRRGSHRTGSRSYSPS